MKIKYLITTILWFSVFTINAQVKLKKVELKDKEKKLIEIYFVKQPENKIKQGEYKLLGFDKKVYISGNYNNSERTGVWKFYGNSGELTREFNFDKDSLVEYKWNENDSTILRVKTRDGWKLKEVSSPPFPQYGDLGFIIVHNLKYPAQALKDTISGTVVVSAHIDKTGFAIRYRLDTKVHELLNEEAMRVVKLISVWYPAICEGKRVECEYLIPVKFELKKK